MASSNRHWPSMFKSKPINHHSCSRSSDNSSFSSGCEERSTPEPKPRWNPKPEQIRILEAIFNSGMVNPPRDEIRRIRTQLQEYGQVGDANVFYWFQNRKSRSKNKQRNLQPKTATNNTSTVTTTTTATSSSSSSSDKNSPNNKSTKNNINNNNNNNNIIGSGGEHFVNSPTSVNQCSSNYFQQLITPNNHLQFHEFVSHEPVYFPLHQNGASILGNNNNNNNNNTNTNNFSPNLCFAHNNNNNNMNGGDHVQLTMPCDETVGGFSSLLFGEIFNGAGGGGGGGGGLKGDDEVEKFKFQQELSFLVSTQDNNTTTNNNNNNNNNGCTTLPSSSHVVSTPISTAITTDLGQFVGEAGGMPGKMTVFINGMAIEVPSGGFNVKEEFGDDVMLVHASTGQPVVTNEWGVTLHGLQQGASYFLVAAHLVASPLLHKLDNAPDIIASDFPYQI